MEHEIVPGATTNRETAALEGMGLTGLVATLDPEREAGGHPDLTEVGGAWKGAETVTYPAGGAHST